MRERYVRWVLMCLVLMSDRALAAGSGHVPAPVAVDLNRQSVDEPPQALRGGPALGLRDLNVYAIYSPGAGTEYTGAFDSVARLHHQGAAITIVTREIGYGNAPLALFNGRPLPPNAHYRTEMICVRQGRYVSPCKSGEVNIGEYRFWRIDPFQAGLFVYQNTSAVSPFRTLKHTIQLH